MNNFQIFLIIDISDPGILNDTDPDLSHVIG